MEALFDEIESLEAILMDDVCITKNPDTGFPELIETTIFPTVGEDTDQQYICVTLQVIPLPGYPEISPEFKLQKPRGLDDARLSEIKEACIKKLSESLGYPVVFDLIEVIREHLTGSNLPSGQCVVCLYGFQEGDEFTKTECYHYLHSYCLARHLIASRRNYNEEVEKLPAWQRKTSKPFEAVCPVCRETIKDDTDHLRTALPPAELEEAPAFHLTDELKDLQNKMTNLFLHQKSRGGIIDLDAGEGTIISLEPEDHADDERKNSEDADQTSSIGMEPQIVQVQQSRQPNIRSNTHRGPNRSQHHHHHHHQHHHQHHHNQPNPIPATQRTATEHSPNTYQSYNSHHHNRRHFQRGRRHHYHHNHQHHHNSNQDDSTSQDHKDGTSTR